MLVSVFTKDHEVNLVCNIKLDPIAPDALKAFTVKAIVLTELRRDMTLQSLVTKFPFPGSNTIPHSYLAYTAKHLAIVEQIDETFVWFVNGEMRDNRNE